MTDAERTDIVMRLVQMQHVLRTVCEQAEASAKAAESAGGDGLAFATLMVKESLEQFSRELNRFVLRSIDDE